MRGAALVVVVAAALCVAACGRDGGGGVRCTVWPGEATDACICSADERVDDDGSELEERTCTGTEFVPDTKCCASPDYGSDPDGFCYCSALRCGDNGFGACDCTFNPYSDIPVGLLSCSAPEGGTCCLDTNGFCHCNASATCTGIGDVQVFECNAEVLTFCQDSEVEIDTCELAEDGGGGGGGGGGGDDGPPPR